MKNENRSNGDGIYSETDVYTVFDAIFNQCNKKIDWFRCRVCDRLMPYLYRGTGQWKNGASCILHCALLYRRLASPVFEAN